MMRDNESLIDISDSIHLIMRYTQGIDLDRFTQNEEKQDAVLRRLIIIGEATKRLSPEFRSQHPTIPWRNIAGLRDIAVHEYERVDLDRIWRIIQTDLLELLTYIQPLLPTQE
ncbi:MAG TPA: DUF86 domain-containing protein [Oscillatoriales cyanobacterium M59_W2019_021]|nr:DUF86 domain-containing protein [Oscillatoriales cyanobacterium M4454_W2019_049]HIK51566.1 DUF86 domain-containing protein [Oscillatoriales cyanobacterium M59_W2019_021]